MPTIVKHYRNSFLDIVNDNIRILMDPWVYTANEGSWAGSKNGDKYIFNSLKKKTIDENLSSRICLTIDNQNVPKCYTTNRKFETCGELAKETPNSLKAEMETLKTEIQTTKTQMMNEMLTMETKLIFYIIIIN
jgi:hypothetical protein